MIFDINPRYDQVITHLLKLPVCEALLAHELASSDFKILRVGSVIDNAHPVRICVPDPDRHIHITVHRIFVMAFLDPCPLPLDPAPHGPCYSALRNSGLRRDGSF